MKDRKGRVVERRLEQVRRFMHTLIDRPELLDSFPEEVYVPLNVDVASLFAPARLELLRSISEEPRTVSDLARSVRRKVPAVSRDLGLLERQGLIQFRTEGRKKYAELIRHFVVLPLDVLPGPKARSRIPAHQYGLRNPKSMAISQSHTKRL